MYKTRVEVDNLSLHRHKLSDIWYINKINNVFIFLQFITFLSKNYIRENAYPSIITGR